MLDEALGENRAYYRIHGYHADILRASILETLPSGWRERLISIPDTPIAWALDPHDLAAVKLLVNRPKDLDLIEKLHSMHLLQPALIRERIDLLKIPVELIPRILASFKTIFQS